MARSSFGSVTEMSRGKYRLRWWQDTPKGRKRCSKVVACKSKREANRMLAEIRVEVEEHRTPSIDTLWNEEVKIFMREDVEKGKRSAQTLKAYETVYNSAIKPALGACPVGELSVKLVQELFLQMSPGRAQTAKSVLGTIMQRAIVMGYCANDPTKARFRYQEKKTTRSEGVWTLAQMDKALEEVRGSVLELAIILCGHAGLRVGEAWGLTIADVEYNGEFMYLSIERAISRDGDVVPLKTKSSRRKAVLSQPYAKRLSEIIAAQDTEWLFEDGVGGVTSRCIANKIWIKTFRGRSDLPYITMSRLRNSYETYMHWELGISQERVSKILGHSDISTTQTYYDLPTSDIASAALVEELKKL
jgi:integrase